MLLLLLGIVFLGLSGNPVGNAGAKAIAAAAAACTQAACSTAVV